MKKIKSFLSRYWKHLIIENIKLSMNQDILFCKKTTKDYGTSYYISTYFFPKDIRLDVWVLYAFLRIPDEMVDNSKGDAEDSRRDILKWIDDWKRAFDGDLDVHPVLRANAVMWKKRNIPFQYSEIFFKAMLSDTEKSTYNTYRELEDYMMGSATVVGYMMSCIIGYTGDALPYARSLAEAFQMTNFIRDIKEDAQRGRVYMPIEDLVKFGLKASDIVSGEKKDAISQLVKFEIDRTENLYKKAMIGIPMLDIGGRRAVKTAFYLYKEILNKIKKDPVVVTSHRVRVGFMRKVIIILKNLY
jgi:phytoene synthase